MCDGEKAIKKKRAKCPATRTVTRFIVFTVIYFNLSPKTMASICVAFLSFCCDSLPLTLSFATAPFSLSAFLSLHPWGPFTLSCRVALRRPGTESVEQGRAGLEILACPGCCDCCGGCSLSWLRKHIGSTSRGWTTASFTSVCHREHDSHRHSRLGSDWMWQGQCE